MPGSFEEVNRTISGGPRDVGQVVRRWGFKFAGDPGESIDTFLERVEENWILAKLTEGEILTALPELSVGVAGIWVRSNRTSWTTYVPRGDDAENGAIAVARLPAKHATPKYEAPAAAIDTAERLRGH